MNSDATPLLSKNKIVEHMEIVITGCYKDFYISNSYSSWKNTAKGLSLMTSAENDRAFHMCINMWIDLTQNQIIGIDIDKLPIEIYNNFSWLNSLLIIKKYIKTYNDNNNNNNDNNINNNDNNNNNNNNNNVINVGK
jgi:hypothetical protein